MNPPRVPATSFTPARRFGGWPKFRCRICKFPPRSFGRRPRLPLPLRLNRVVKQEQEGVGEGRGFWHALRLAVGAAAETTRTVATKQEEQRLQLASKRRRGAKSATSPEGHRTGPRRRTRRAPRMPPRVPPPPWTRSLSWPRCSVCSTWTMGKSESAAAVAAAAQVCRCRADTETTRSSSKEAWPRPLHHERQHWEEEERQLLHSPLQPPSSNSNRQNRRIGSRAAVAALLLRLLQLPPLRRTTVTVRGSSRRLRLPLRWIHSVIPQGAVLASQISPSSSGRAITAPAAPLPTRGVCSIRPYQDRWEAGEAEERSCHRTTATWGEEQSEEGAGSGRRAVPAPPRSITRTNPPPRRARDQRRSHCHEVSRGRPSL
mmetsp:Transcript_17457/g.38159  ORF Transcript_17457/g.38159 Transcript_17457/m.38159 type:complete len:374 (+) Transcript_17457:772-1893(+)